MSEILYVVGKTVSIKRMSVSHCKFEKDVWDKQNRAIM